MYRGDHRSSRNKDSNEIIEVSLPSTPPAPPKPPTLPVRLSPALSGPVRAAFCAQPSRPTSPLPCGQHQSTLASLGSCPPPAVHLRDRPDQDGWACHVLVGSATSLLVTNVPELNAAVTRLTAIQVMVRFCSFKRHCVPLHECLEPESVKFPEVLGPRLCAPRVSIVAS